jgi:TPP-dependent pyruvate/acetoin dehydrogenase alpha subunit
MRLHARLFGFATRFSGLWDAEKELALRESARKDVLAAFNAAEAERKPPVSELFTDVYHDVCLSLVKVVVVVVVGNK